MGIRAGGRLCAACVGLGLLNGVAMAEEPLPWLLGDWGGKRSALAAQGFDFEFVATVDVLGTVDGGLDEGFEAPGNFDLVMSVDTGAAGWWQNGTFNFYFLGNAGGDPSTRTGDYQVASNIEAPNTFKLYEAWYEHRFANERVSVLVGLHDLNSEFYVTEHGLLFLNSSFGIGPEIGQAVPSFFPTTSPAVRLRVAPTTNTYVIAAVYDGVPGDPADPYGTEVAFDDGDGVFGIGEIGLIGSGTTYYKLGLGGWITTAQFDDFAGDSHNDNAGIYLIGERDLWRADDGRGIGVFAQLGFADEEMNQTGTYAGAGINWTGPLPSRPTDVAGFAVAHARNGDDFRAANPGIERAETALEWTYLIPAAPWLNIQPDVQYVIDPGTDPTLDNAVVVGFRVQVAL